MQRYQLTAVVKSTLKNEAKDEFLKKMEKTVKALGGSVLKTAEMGLKQMAYKIGGASEAQYLGWTLELPAAGVVQLSRKLNVDKEVLRYLLVKAAEVKKVAREKKSR